MPITPLPIDAVTLRPLRELPDEVLGAFNEMIQEKWDGTSAIIPQDEAITRILANFQASGVEQTREALFEKHWLDVEPVYRAQGWVVEYDKPCRGDSEFQPYFKFRVPRPS